RLFGSASLRLDPAAVVGRVCHANGPALLPPSLSSIIADPDALSWEHAEPSKLPTPAPITPMVNRIVKKLHPQQIILFESHAQRVAGPASDVDLLVMMPVHGMGMHVPQACAVATLGSSIPISPLAPRATRARSFDPIEYIDPIFFTFCPILG